MRAPLLSLDRSSLARLVAGALLSSLVPAGAAVLWAPAGPVLTPGGPRSPSLVRVVEEGEALRQRGEDGALALVSATGELSFSPPATTAQGQQLEAGWITYAHWTNEGPPLTSFVSTWRVPPPPSTRSGQTIFLFNGIQNTGVNYGILQPVLQWGVSAAGGGPYWSVASWYVTSRGQAFHTRLVRVKPGDTLVGLMTLGGRRGARFTYRSQFVGLPGTTLTVEDIAELRWCNETLEAYAVRGCSDYPAATAVPFTGIHVVNDLHPPLTWTPVHRVTDCGQHVEVVSHSSTAGQVDVRFSPARR